MPELVISEEGTLKRCSQCRQFKPQTAEYFSPMACRLYKELRSECRDCQNAYQKHYKSTHKKVGVRG